jgi:hypothetical protein
MIKLATVPIDDEMDDSEPTELAEEVAEAEFDQQVEEGEFAAADMADDEDDDDESSDDIQGEQTDGGPEGQITAESEVTAEAPAEAFAEQPPTAIAPAKPIEKIMQVPDSVRERDLRLIEAHQNDIRNYRSTVRERFLEWSDAKKEAKAAKDSYESAVAKLLEVIDEGPVRQHSLFPAAPITEEQKSEAITVKAEPAKEESTVPADATSATETSAADAPKYFTDPNWRQGEIGAFMHGEVPDALSDLVEDYEIEDVGELVDVLISAYLNDEQLAQVRAEIETWKQTSVKPDPTPPDDGDDSWRALSIDELDIPKSLREKLREAEITSVGGIADWTSSGKNLTDIRGVGEAKAEKIQDALEKVWANRKAIAEQPTHAESA